MSQKIAAVVSVLGKDRTGIVAKVSNTLYEAGVNIDDIDQTILNDIFAMTMLVTLDETKTPFEKLQAQLTVDGETLGMQIKLQKSQIFEAMHQV